MEMPNPTWSPPKISQDVASLDDLKLIFSEVKERVVETTDEAERLYQRSATLFLICIPALATIISYLGANFKVSVLNINLLITGIVLWVICTTIKDNLKPKQYMANGTQAANLFIDDFFTNLNDKKSEWYMLYNLIKDYQYRYERNKDKNAERVKNIEDAIRFLYWIPPFSLIIWLLFLIIPNSISFLNVVFYLP